MKLAASGAIAAALALAACTSGPGDPAAAQTGPGHSVQAGPATDWPAYHFDAARSGLAPGLPAAGRLAIGWSRGLGAAVYGQPLVVGDMVIAATERDTVFGLDRASGSIRWSTHVATALPLQDQPCGNIDPLGITGTPVYYRGLVYALAQAGRTGHVLVGIDPANGRVRYRRAVLSPDHQPRYDQQRSALAAGNGRIYVAFGGHFGDCGPYIGSVVGVPAAGPRSGSRPIVTYRVPSSLHAGIWAPAGPVIGPRGTVYVGVGNGDTSPPFDDSDSVTALSPGLRRIGVFAPAAWLADNRADLDLGSLSPALTRAGLVLAVGKRGVGYLLSAGHLGGVGGQIAQARVCPAFGGTSVTGQHVIVPCASGGPAAVAVSAGGLRVLWRGPPTADGSPVIGGGAIWVTDTTAGVLYELSPSTGRVLHRQALGSQLPHFASPSLSGRLVLIGTLRGVVAVTGA
jgi:outer membrane protein assembly factor BamB